MKLDVTSIDWQSVGYNTKHQVMSTVLAITNFCTQKNENHPTKRPLLANNWYSKPFHITVENFFIQLLTLIPKYLQRRSLKIMTLVNYFIPFGQNQMSFVNVFVISGTCLTTNPLCSLIMLATSFVVRTIIWSKPSFPAKSRRFLHRLWMNHDPDPSWARYDLFP